MDVEHRHTNRNGMYGEIENKMDIGIEIKIEWKMKYIELK